MVELRSIASSFIIAAATLTRIGAAEEPSKEAPSKQDIFISAPDGNTAKILAKATNEGASIESNPERSLDANEQIFEQSRLSKALNELIQNDELKIDENLYPKHNHKNLESITKLIESNPSDLAINYGNSVIKENNRNGEKQNIRIKHAIYFHDPSLPEDLRGLALFFPANKILELEMGARKIPGLIKDPIFVHSLVEQAINGTSSQIYMKAGELTESKDGKSIEEFSIAFTGTRPRKVYKIKIDPSVSKITRNNLGIEVQENNIIKDRIIELTIPQNIITSYHNPSN